MKKKSSLIFYLVLTVVFAYDVITVESWGTRIIRAILVIICAMACYGELKALKEKK